MNRVKSSTGGVLITGGTGFAGSHLVRHLKLNAVGISVLATRLAGSNDPDVDYYSVDIRDRESVFSLIERLYPSTIYHLAGVSAVDVSWSKPRFTYEVNVTGAYNVFEAAMNLAKTPKVLNVSTGQVYAASQLVLTENSLVRPDNPYAATKAMAELLTVQYANRAVGGILTARSFNHTGPGQGSNFFLSAVAKQFVEIEHGRRPAKLVVGDIDVRRDFTDVRDIVRAYTLLVESGKMGEVYNVCSGVAVRLADIVQLFEAKAGIRVCIEKDPNRVRLSDARQISGDSTKLRDETGWFPVIPLEQTVEDMLSYWRSDYRALPISF
jgi:GDP-4-dehydro-6-deoxy-D-mannose reductase